MYQNVSCPFQSVVLLSVETGCLLCVYFQKHCMCTCAYIKSYYIPWRSQTYAKQVIHISDTGSWDSNMGAPVGPCSEKCGKMWGFNADHFCPSPAPRLLKQLHGGTSYVKTYDIVRIFEDMYSIFTPCHLV